MRSIISFIAVLAFTGAVWAADEQAVIAEFNLPAQGLADSLRAVATQMQTSLVFDDGAVSGRQAPALKARVTVDEAVARLLVGSGLTHRRVDERTIVLAPVGKTLSRAPAGRDDVWTLAQTEAAHPRDVSAASPQGEKLEEISVDIPEILVTGSKSLNTDIQRTRDGVSPYIVLDRKLIEQSGAKDVEELLRTRLTMNGGNSGSPSQQRGNLNAGTTLITLRGLSSRETLILVDGHRIAGWNEIGISSQPDLNGIPLSAIERIEVLPATASGIYGGSATGGVINIVLRRDYSGVSANLSFQNSFEGGGASERVDLASGFSLEDGKTRVLLSGSYADSSNLLAGDRNLLERGRAQIFAHDPGFYLDGFAPPLGATTNILSADGSPLQLKSQYGGATLSSNATYVPDGYRGAALDGAGPLAANAGRFNLALANTAQPNGGRGQAIVSTPTVKSLGATLRRQFSPTVEAFLDLSASDNKSEFAGNSLDGVFFIPAAAPNNPFEQDLTVTTPVFGVNGVRFENSMTSRRAVGGVIVQLPADWKASTDYTWSRTSVRSTSPPTVLSSTASDAVGDGTLDVLRDTNGTGIDFSPYNLESSDVFGPARTTLRDGTLRFSGPVPWALPGGKITLSSLVEYKKESLGTFQEISATASTIQYPRSQTVRSLYIEAHAPLLHALELQVAGRHDEYTNVGSNSTSNFIPQNPVTVTNKSSSTDPTVGLRFAPVADLALRASYGTGFLPPALNQFVPNLPDLRNLTIFGLRDPLRGGERLGRVTVTSGGNPDLRPEQSQSRSAGFILTPHVLPGLRMSADWTRIDKSDNIALFLPALTQRDLNTVVNFFPQRVGRGANLPGDQPGWPGPITSLNQTYINIARQNAEAVDLAVDYAFEPGRFGDFHLSAQATRQIHLSQKNAPDSPEVENVGLGGALKWTSTAALTWSYRGWTAAWTARYFDHYWLSQDHSVVAAQDAATIPSQLYHDLFASYRFGRSASGTGLKGGARWLNGLEIQGGIKNVFNKAPLLDVVTDTTYFYSNYGDPLRATYYLNLKADF